LHLKVNYLNKLNIIENMEKKKVILIIRDGWGYRKDKKDNAIVQTKTPNTDFLMKKYPNVLINASGINVGLPKNYQGNSEVGHLTIGSGRLIFQSMERINQSIKDGSFFKIKEFISAIKNCKKNKTNLHIAGLLQVEGVHSHINHLFALLDLCKKENFKNVKLHLFTDGRDAPVTASLKMLTKLEKKLKELNFGEIVTVSGRYYAMDRDKRWERTKKVYECIVNSSGIEFDNVRQTIIESHKQNVTDEFILPRKKKNYNGLKENDSFIFYNFRTDRTRQLTQAIVENKFNDWKRKKVKLFYVAMTQFYKDMNAQIAFKEIKLNNLLGNVVSDAKLKQLRISETEKYAHVTFFFNGQVEKPNKKEDRILIHSPKVATYDLKPEMSVYEVTDALVKEIDKNIYDLIVVNLVNGDMVGHTGIIKAIKKAISAVDECVGKIVKHGLDKNYTLLVFADHGNAEDQTPKWRTSHTINPVPFILVSKDEQLMKAKLKKGMGLKDVAPTAIHLLGLKKPKEMTGESIIF
jgi:2,3-bisphosphoglycerate-independent phosphoglycerate mutase